MSSVKTFCMIAPDRKRSENVQTMVTRDERSRLMQLAKHEGYPLSYLVRILVLESLAVWEKSANGRKAKR
jgi:hypothetical protein